MRIERHLAACAAVLAAISAWAVAADAPAESVALTVYNDGNAIVKEVREIDVPKGAGEVRFDDVAKTIDPTTVTFKSLTDPAGTTILEQNYEYDLVNANKILEKYLGQQVAIVTKDGATFSGNLMSFDDAGLVVMRGGGELAIIERADNVKSIQTSGGAGGLIVKPMLAWLVNSTAGGRQQIQVAYSASACSWRADYIAVLDDKDTAFDLDGWVTLTNNTGKTYKDARLKLVAGEVHRVMPPVERAERDSLQALADAVQVPQFEEKAFAEYHLYTLPRATTVKDSEVKQIELLAADGVPVAEKKYLFDVMRGFHPYWQGPMTEDFSVAEKGKVAVFIAFKNDEKSHLGMPLPAGKVRLFKRDGRDLEFIGEDSIEHTPKDEKIELQMGDAFDISGDRTRTDFTAGNGARWMEESFEISLRNHKKEQVTVDAREHLFRWTNWQIKAKSQDYTKLDAQTIEFPVTLAPDEEKKVTYTVRYEW